VYEPPAGSTVFQYDILLGSAVTTEHRVLTLNGQAVSTEFLMITAPLTATPSSTTFSPAETSELVAVKHYAMLNLVHKAGDASPGASSSSSSGNSAPSSTSSHSAASGKLAGGNNVGGVWPLVVVAAALTTGAALMLQL
jgi:hypothetical protein